MTAFPLHTLDTAPAASRPHLQGVMQRFGFLPNIHAFFAEAPLALEALLQLGTLFGRTSLTEHQRHVLLLTASVENRCFFCVAAHTRGALAAGLPAATIGALRDGSTPENPQDAALVAYVRAVIRERGSVSDQELGTFLSAGFTRKQALEVVLGVTAKILTNYVNHITHPQLNPELVDHAWPGP